MKNLMYLLDTNIISEATKPCPCEKVLEKMANSLDFSCISSITWAEAMTGVKTLTSGRRQEALFKFLVDTVQSQFPIIPFDASCAMMYAHLVQGLKARGKMISNFDIMIAACAISNNLILVTRNSKDFESMTELAPLMIENWFL